MKDEAHARQQSTPPPGPRSTGDVLRLPPTALAHTWHCKLPPATGKPGRIVRGAGTRHAQHSSGHGGAARPRSHQRYGSLSESAVEPEPASESEDATNDVVSRPSESPSRAAAALAAARVFSATSRRGRTTRPTRNSPFSACRHQASATGRSASSAKIVRSNIAPTSSGSLVLVGNSRHAWL